MQELAKFINSIDALAIIYLVIFFIVARIGLNSFTFVFTRCFHQWEEALVKYYNARQYARRVDRIMHFGRNRLWLLHPQWSGMPSSKFIDEMLAQKERAESGKE